jgi:hypothetical protein
MSDVENWVVPYAGFRYQQDTIAVSAAHQQEKLAACGIDADVFAGFIDPAFFIGIAIHAGIHSGISAEGNINMLQALNMHRPVALGEELVVQGRILAVTEVPRGLRVETDVWFEDASGARVISAPRTSLRPDPQRAGVKGAGERPVPVIEDVNGLTLLDRYQLSPEGVRAYSIEGNSIHYELEPAQRAGFRAPLIGGGMGVHFLMAELWKALAATEGPKSFAAQIYFRRPIFWDESVGVFSRAGSTSGWDAMALIKEDELGNKKVATEIGLQLRG